MTHYFDRLTAIIMRHRFSHSLSIPFARYNLIGGNREAGSSPKKCQSAISMADAAQLIRFA